MTTVDQRRLVVCSWMVAGFLLLGSLPAFAEPRLVRVIWDVGQGIVLAKPESRTKTGYDAFVLPADMTAALAAGFTQSEQFETDVLAKGDRIRFYIVNFNSVAHVWNEAGSTVETILPDPSMVSVFLNAALMNINGAKGFPGAGLVVPMGFMAAGPPPACSPLNSKLNALMTAGQNVHAAGTKIVTHTRAAQLPAVAVKLAAVPTQTDFWNTWANTTAWQLILNDKRVFGIDFATEFQDFGATAEAYGKTLEVANAALLEFDAELMKIATPAVCKAYEDARDNIQGYLRSVTAADSPVSQLVTIHKASATLWKDYQRKLTGWNDAVEMAGKDPVPAEAVVRVEALFLSPDPKFTTRARRSVALEVRTFFPALTISSGIGVNQFHFKKLQAQQTVMTVDGSPVAKTKLEIVDDTSWDRIVPVWTQNVRVFKYKEVGFYGTFGTTPDRNIFKNAIYGVSVVIPKWRTVLTYGRITAKGYEQEDLEAAVGQFTDATTGLAIKDADVAKLPLPETEWKKSRYASITFMLVSF